MRPRTESLSGLPGSGQAPDSGAGGDLAPDPVRAGSVLADKYRLVSEIGRGGMGSVWRAEHLAWQAPVAVKMMTRDMAAHPEALARFEREVRLAAGLRSPHVVQVLDHGIDAPTRTPFIVMELLEGESLARRLRRAGRLSPAETFLIISQLARALSRAHAAGIVHRDLKPDNVFLVRNEDETVTKVLDFGVAKWSAPSLPRGGLTRPGSVLGTPFYMSPEQIQGSREIDHRADLWSLAAIACECLTGRRPFEAEDFAQLAVLLLTRQGRPLPSSLGSVPAGFDAWFERATAADIDRRFQSARELAQTLAPICGAAPSAVAPDSFPVPGDLAQSRDFPSMAPVSHTASLLQLPRRLWRRPLVRFGLSLVVGLGVTGAGIAWWSRQDLAALRSPRPQSSSHPDLHPAQSSAPSVGVQTRALEPSPRQPTPMATMEPTRAQTSPPGVRPVSEPAAPEALERGQPPTSTADDGTAVANARDGVEVDRASRGTARSNAGKRTASPPRARRKKAAPAAPAAAGAGAPRPEVDSEPASPSVDVNGRRIRTAL